MRLYRRAAAFYRADVRKLVLLLSLNAAAIVLALAAPWPLAVALDSLLTHEAPAPPSLCPIP